MLKHDCLGCTATHCLRHPSITKVAGLMAICSGERGFDLQKKYVEAWDAKEAGDTPRPKIARLMEPMRVTDTGRVVGGGCTGCGGASPARQQPTTQPIVRDITLTPLVIPPRASDRIIVTLAVGAKFQQLKRLVWPMLEAYADKCEADIYCIDTVSSGYAFLGKFHLPEFFAAGYRDVLFLDCDLIIEPDAPSIFDEYPEAVLAMHDDFQQLHGATWLENEYAALNTSQGITSDVPKTCWNTGVILMRRGCEAAFEMPAKPFPETHTSEQSLINLGAFRNGIEVTPLPRVWNEQWWPNRKIEPREGTHVYHWSNAPHEQRVAEMSARLGVEPPPFIEDVVVEPAKPQKKKTRLENAISLATTVAKTAMRKVTTGTALLSLDVIQARLDICETCEQFSGSACNLCSCHISGELIAKNKLAHASSVCPHQPPKWLAEDAKKKRRVEVKIPFVPPMSRTKIKRVDDFTGPITRHLIYHIWPAKHSDTWRWNLDQLIARIDQFNGRRIIGIATDAKSVPAQEVKDYLTGHHCEFVDIRNDPKLGEVATFAKMLALVRTTDLNAIVFYGHAKGVKYEPQHRLAKHMRDWSSAMYEGCLDRPEEVDNALSDHAFAGGFKHRKQSGHWYYSGTFFWFRASAVFDKQTNIPTSQRWGVEWWPHQMVETANAACLFGDDAGRMYDPKNLVEAMAKPRRFTRPVATASMLADGVTLITPTGDRPHAFALCEKWMARQSYTGPLQWIVVDDGSVPTAVTQGQEYVRREPRKDDPKHTLCRNILEALPHVRHEKIIIIEDDDYYEADYVETLAGWLDHADLVGDVGAKYYWLNSRRWYVFADHEHASLCRTGFRSCVLPTFHAEAERTDNQSLDLRLWAAWRGTRHRHRDERRVLSIGMKGLPGRRGSTWGVWPKSKLDTSGHQLRKWLGDDTKHYLPGVAMLTKPETSLGEVFVYTAIFGRYDRLTEQPKQDGVSYVCVTDTIIPPPSSQWSIKRTASTEPTPRRSNRRAKINVGEMFPDAEWSIYIDGNLRLTIDPLKLIELCWSIDSDAEMFLTRHPERVCVYAEAEECKRLRMDDAKTIDAQAMRYQKAEYPADAGLYYGGLIIRRGPCEALAAAWWGEVSHGSHRDQISLPVALLTSGVRLAVMPGLLSDYCSASRHRR